MYKIMVSYVNGLVRESRNIKRFPEITPHYVRFSEETTEETTTTNLIPFNNVMVIIISYESINTKVN